MTEQPANDIPPPASSSPSWRLEEWQTMMQSGDIALDRAALLDILSTHEAPWGLLASLSRQELVAYLQQPPVTMETNKEPIAAAMRLDNLPSTPDSRNSSGSSNKSSPSSRSRINSPPPAKQRPFPLGPPPTMVRTNPVTGRRDAVTQYSKTGDCRQNDYQFAGAVAEADSHSQDSILADRSYAEVMVRLHPLLFLTLYEHEKKHGRLGICPHTSNSNKNLSTSPVRNDPKNDANSEEDTDMIVVHGIPWCSRALVGGLTRAYALGCYQQWTLDQILTYLPHSVCKQKHANSSGNSQPCNRHYMLLSWKDICEREKTLGGKRLERQGAADTATKLVIRSRDCSRSLSPPSPMTPTNKSPDTLHTVSTITTSASSELAYHQRMMMDMTEHHRRRTVPLTPGRDSSSSPMDHSSQHQYSRQARLVDSSSSHPLRAPYRPGNHNNADSVCCESQSQSTATWASRPKSFWPHDSADKSQFHPPIPQVLGGAVTCRLLEPVAVRAASSDSLEAVLSGPPTISGYNKMAAAAASPSSVTSARRRVSTPNHGYSSTMAIFAASGNATTSLNSSGGASKKSIISIATGVTTTPRRAKAPAMTMQLQWNSSSTTLPVSNLFGSRRRDTPMPHEAGTIVHDELSLIADGNDDSVAPPPMSSGLKRRDSESTLLQSDCDEMDTTANSDIDSQATQCSLPTKSTHNRMRRLLEADNGASPILFEDLWQQLTSETGDDTHNAVPTSPLKSTKSSSGGSTIKSGSSGKVSVLSSSPVSVATLEFGELLDSLG